MPFTFHNGVYDMRPMSYFIRPTVIFFPKRQKIKGYQRK